MTELLFHVAGGMVFLVLASCLLGLLAGGFLALANRMAGVLGLD